MKTSVGDYFSSRIKGLRGKTEGDKRWAERFPVKIDEEHSHIACYLSTRGATFIGYVALMSNNHQHESLWVFVFDCLCLQKTCRVTLTCTTKDLRGNTQRSKKEGEDKAGYIKYYSQFHLGRGNEQNE